MYPLIETGTPAFIVGMATLLLGSPFLSFIIGWTRRKADKDNTIISGAGEAVSALSESLAGVRGEVRILREELTDTRRVHTQEITKLKRAHDQEMENVRTEHRDEIKRLEKRHTRELFDLEARLTGRQTEPG